MAQTQTEKRTSKSLNIQGRLIKFVRPNIGQGRIADMEYAKQYSDALKQGLPARAKAERMIEEQGLWPVENEQRIAQLGQRLQELLVELKTNTDKENLKDSRREFNEIDQELAVLDVQKRQLYIHTAESKGEEARIACLAWQCILNEDNSNVWKSQEDFYSAPSDDFVGQAVRDFIIFLSDSEEALDEVLELLGETPEDEEEPEAEVEETKEEPTKEEAPKESTPDPEPPVTEDGAKPEETKE
jgi:hypothetical protein